MSGLLPGRKVQAGQHTAVSGLQLQSSAYGKAIPLVYGTTRVAPNLIWYGDFQATAQNAGGAGGGKGGVGGGGGGKGAGGSTTYNYATAVAMALCEGPIQGVGNAYIDKNVTTPASLGLSVFTGTYPQSPWGHLSTNHPTEALGYSGIPYLAASDYQLGTSPHLPNHNFEVKGVHSDSLSGIGVLDADPSLVITDLLTNEHYGCGFPASRLGSLTTYQAYCIANGLWVSAAYTQQNQASSLLDDIKIATNSEFVWSSGTLRLVPYGDQPVTANGYSYTPPSAPEYDLTDDDFVSADGEDPVLMTRARSADAMNSIKIEYLDRTKNYNPAVVEAKDQALIDQFGLRQDPPRQAHMFADGNAARLSVQLQLQRQAVRNVYRFTLDERYILLDPMDIVTLTDSAIGLDRQWVRITEITENDDGTLAFTAEEYLNGTGSAPAYSFQQGQGFAVNYNQSPGNVNSPVFFEPPDALGNGLEVWAAISGQSPSLWGGCDVWISTDGETYAFAGRVNGAARQGLLTAALPSVTEAATGPTIDSVNALSVDLSQSAGTLLSGSQADALNLNTICYVDGELIAYQTATLVSDNSYDLTWLVRGAYGSTIGSHNSGAQFARLDTGIFKYPFPASYIGTTIYLKFLSFNLYGGAVQSLQDVNPYAYTIQGTALTEEPANVTGLSTAYIAGLSQMTWNPVGDFRQIDYEIRLGSEWNNAQVIGRTPLTHAPVLGDGTYWVAAHYTVPNGPEVYSPTPASITIAGSQLTTNVIETFDEAGTGWLGTFTDTAVNDSNQLTLVGAGDILDEADITALDDIIYYGGVASTGTYQVPESHRVNIGRVDACNVLITLGAVVGYSLNAVDLTQVADVIGVTDILGIALGSRVWATPQIRLSQDGIVWGEWQNWIPGSYVANEYDFQVVLNSEDPQVVPVLTTVQIAVDVPDLVQSGSNVTIAAGGTGITFASEFNGGPGDAETPNIQVTILNGQAGDDVILTDQTLTGFTVQVLNGGVGVERSINWIAQGY